MGIRQTSLRGGIGSRGLAWWNAVVRSAAVPLTTAPLIAVQLMATVASAELPAAAAPAGPVAVPVSRARTTTSKPSPSRNANNATYLELGGGGIFWTMNYERTVKDVVSFRIGTGVFPPASFFFPFTASYHGIGTLAHSLELGLGGTLISWQESQSRTTAFGALLFAGYRYQPPDGGFFFRLGLDVHLQDRVFDELTDSSVIPWPYLGLGGTFPH